MQNSFDNTQRKQILKCVLLSVYLVLLLTVHPRSSTSDSISSNTSNASNACSLTSASNDLNVSENITTELTIELNPVSQDPIYLLTESQVKDSYFSILNEEEYPTIEENCIIDVIPADLDSIVVCSVAEFDRKVEENFKLHAMRTRELQKVELRPEKQVEIEQVIYTPPANCSPHPVEWDGSVLTARKGVNQGPSGKETYYNLPMDGIVNMMHSLGYEDEHWIREDGVHMLGDYVMVAANLSVHPRGSVVETSLGMGRVCDTGGFARKNPTQLDIATNW